MRGTELQGRIARSLATLVESADELRDLDQALGDGDLGITITAGSNAVIAELEKLPESATPTEIARTCAKAFANANPSTMAALVAGALLAGSRVWDGKDEIGLPEAAAFGVVFTLEAGLFLASAVMALRIMEGRAPGRVTGGLVPGE